ncbi:hypothetical protein Leryth_020116 [Lithospermum erythrorhizon]|nr:hypothetical protein Leryth_020116 [Lithospermum erythrorhizon]
MTMAMRFYALSGLHYLSFFFVKILICHQTSYISIQAFVFAASSSVTIMMSKKVEEIKEIRGKTNEEINEEVVDLKGELFMLRLQKAARNEFKQSEFRRMRKRKYNSRVNVRFNCMLLLTRSLAGYFCSIQNLLQKIQLDLPTIKERGKSSRRSTGCQESSTGNGEKIVQLPPSGEVKRGGGRS